MQLSEHWWESLLDGEVTDVAVQRMTGNWTMSYVERVTRQKQYVVVPAPTPEVTAASPTELRRLVKQHILEFFASHFGGQCDEASAQEATEGVWELSYWLAPDEQPSNLLPAELIDELKKNKATEPIPTPIPVTVEVPEDVKDKCDAIWQKHKLDPVNFPSGAGNYDLVLGRSNDKAKKKAASVKLNGPAVPEWMTEMRRAIEDAHDRELNGSTFYDAHLLDQNDDMLGAFDVHRDEHGKRGSLELSWSCTILLHVRDRGTVPVGHPVGRFVVLGTDPVAYVHPGTGFLFEGAKYAHRTIPKKGVALYKLTFFWYRSTRQTVNSGTKKRPRDASASR